MRRVLLPMLAPAIFASAVLVFSTTHGGNGGPALNALATIILVMFFVVAVAEYFGYR